MADEPTTAVLDPAGRQRTPATVFAALAEIIYQGSDAAEMYAAICVAATLVVRGCDHASLLVRRNGRYVTVGASDRIAQRIDDMERIAGDGPCIDAIEEETPQIDTDLTTPSLWPKLAARLVAETPVRGAMGFRLLVDKRNRCRAQPVQRHPQHVRHRVRRAGGGAGIVRQRGHQRRRHRARTPPRLRRGLLSNREIGKAVGMLMLLHDDDRGRGVRRAAPLFPGPEHQARRRGAGGHRNRGKLPFGDGEQRSPST